ncbi:MAG: DUF5686 family protein [Mangrovibacterium sp.]
MRNRLIILFLLSLSALAGFSQTLSGTVEDKTNGEALPFANVWMKGTQQGTITDTGGNFTIKFPQSDTLCISSVGYIMQEIPVKRKGDTRLQVKLQPEVRLINEVTIKPEIPRARVLFNLIQAHKKKNRQQVLAVTDYKTMTNTTFYIAVDTTSRIIRSFGNVDEVTVKVDGQDLRFSPVYLYEEARAFTADSAKLVDHKKSSIFPRLTQAFESVILKNMVAELDFYKDQIFILDRGFISPLSSSALSHYNLYLNDSTLTDSTKYFNFSFAPKNRFNQLFSGRFTIEDGSFALTSLDAYISKDANLNFVNGFEGHVSYNKQPNGNWFYKEQRIGVNLSTRLSNDSVSVYSSKRMQNIETGNWLINKTTRYSTSDRLDAIRPASWKDQPEFASDRPEEDPHTRVDKISEQEVVKGIDAIGGMVLSSYLNAGKIDIGPVYEIYSTNTIEGKRFSIPLRTSQQFSEHFSVGGLLGYGTRNKEFQFGANLIWQPGETDRFIFRFNYSNDYMLLSQDKYLRFIKNNPNNKGTGNFIALFTSREENPYLKKEENYEFRAEYNSLNGTHIEFAPYLLLSKSTPAVFFARNGTAYDRYKNYGFMAHLRYTFGQSYDKYFFDRVYYVNPIPVISLSMDVGQTLLPGQSMKHAGLYAQLHGAIQGRINFGQVFMNYIFNAGFLSGKAPYDLLDQPVGSMSLGFAKDRYNLLHFAAFAHNLYTNTHLHFNGGGILLNRIPFVRKLKLREILSVKLHYGTLNDAYDGVFDLPNFYHNEISKPYTEIGLGLTNIFKVLRVEYVHQFNPSFRDKDFTDNGGIRIRGELSF